MDFINDIVEDFSLDQIHDSRRDASLPFYQLLEQWVETGSAIEKTGGDRSLYLAAVVQIVATAETDDRFKGRFEHPLLPFGNCTCQALEAEFWDAAVGRFKLGIHRKI